MSPHAYGQMAAGTAAGPGGDSVTIVGSETDPVIAAMAHAVQAACLQREAKLKGSRACGVFIYEFDASRGEELSTYFKTQDIAVPLRALVGLHPAKDGNPAHAQAGLMDPDTRATTWIPMLTLIRGWNYPYHFEGSRIQGNYHYRLVDFLTPEDCRQKPAMCARYGLAGEASFDLDRFEAKHRNTSQLDPARR